MSIFLDESERKIVHKTPPFHNSLTLTDSSHETHTKATTIHAMSHDPSLPIQLEFINGHHNGPINLHCASIHFIIQ